MKQYFDALDDILDRPIAFNPSFKKITGSTNAALLLSQAFYWSKRTKDPEGWFYKVRQEWVDETGLTEDELDGARLKCRERGVIEEKLKGVPATLHYRVNKQKVYELLGVQIPTFPESGFPGNSQIPTFQESGKDGNFNKESEITTETTNNSGRALSERELQQANAKVDAILENARKAKYPLREKMPDAYLPFCDAYVQLTGQPLSKRVFTDWLATFEDWRGEGLSPADIEAAYRHATRPEGGFMVTRPGSLTNTAVAIKAKGVVTVQKAEENDPFASLNTYIESENLHV